MMNQTPKSTVDQEKVIDVTDEQAVHVDELVSDDVVMLLTCHHPDTGL